MKKLQQCMCNGLVTAFLITAAAGTAVAGSKENAQGALLRNPARLGFASGYSSVVGMDGKAPGADTLDGLFDKYYDLGTQTLKFDIDFSDEDSLANFQDDVNRFFDGLSKVDGQGVAGMALGKAALGVVGNVGGGVSGTMSSVDSDGNVSVDLDAHGEAKADAIAALGFPIRGRLAGGIAVKKSLLSQINGYARMSTDDMADDPDNYEYGADYKRGEGNLLDLGVYYKADKYQLDLVLRDFGTVTWTPVSRWDKPFGESDVVTTPENSQLKEETSMARLAGGVTLTPAGSVSLGCFYDKSLSLELEYRPVKWVFLRSGYISGEVGPANMSLGAGLKIGFLGIDFATYFCNGSVTGGSSRISVEF